MHTSDSSHRNVPGGDVSGYEEESPSPQDSRGAFPSVVKLVTRSSTRLVPWADPGTPISLERSANPMKSNSFVTASDSVACDIFLDFIRKQEVDHSVCIRIPFYIFLIVFTAFLAPHHVPIKSSKAVSVALADFLSAAKMCPEDVNSREDFYLWLRTGIIPLVYAEVASSIDGECEVEIQQISAQNKSLLSSLTPRCLQWSIGKRCDQEENNTLVREECDRLLRKGRYQEKARTVGEIFDHTFIIGGFRLRQHIGSYASCQWQMWWNYECDSTAYDPFPAYDRIFTHSPSVMDLPISTLHYDEYLLLRAPQTEMLEAVRYLEHGCPLVRDGSFSATVVGNMSSEWQASSSCSTVSTEHVQHGSPWTSNATNHMATSFVTVNRELRLVSLTEVHFVIDKSGKLYPVVDTVSQHLGGNRPYLVGCDVLFLIINMCVIWSSQARLFSSVRRKWHQQSLALLRNPDHKNRSLARIFARKFFFTVLLRPHLYLTCTCAYLCYVWIRHDFSVQALTSYAQDESMAISQNIVGNQTLAHIFELADDALDRHSIRTFRVFVGVYLVIAMSLLFLALDDQPHLAFVTRTVAKAGPHLLNFFIVWSFTLLCFTASAWMIFGETSEEFSDTATTMITLYRCMYGEFPSHTAFQSTGFDWVALPFFMGFTIVFLLVLVNIVLAVLLEAYCSIIPEMEVSMTTYAYVHSAVTFYQNRVFHQYIGMNTIQQTVRQYVYDIAPTVWPSPKKVDGDSSRDSVGHLWKLDVDILLAIVPKMPSDQAKELLWSAQMHQVRKREVNARNLQRQYSRLPLLPSSRLTKMTKMDTLFASDKTRSTPEDSESPLEKARSERRGKFLEEPRGRIGFSERRSVGKPVEDFTSGTSHLGEDRNGKLGKQRSRSRTRFLDDPSGSRTRFLEDPSGSRTKFLEDPSRASGKEEFRGKRSPVSGGRRDISNERRLQFVLHGKQDHVSDKREEIANETPRGNKFLREGDGKEHAKKRSSESRHFSPKIDPTGNEHYFPKE